jgi:hypothetical protein
MVKVVLMIVAMGMLAACAKRTSSEPVNACTGFAPGPIAVTSCP